MYLPRSLIAHLYSNLVKTHHPTSPPVLILVALEPDALCACRILTALLKRDYIPHKIKPVAGYGDLSIAGQQLVQPMRLSDGGSGGVVICLGVGGLVDIENILGLEKDEDGSGGMEGVDLWILDARRPWNLANVFGGSAATVQDASGNEPVRKDPGMKQGKLSRAFKPGMGGIIVFDDGDIEEELSAECEAWFALEDMPDIEDNGSDISDSEDEDSEALPNSRKRKVREDDDDDAAAADSADEASTPPPPQRRRSNSSSPLPATPTRRLGVQVPSSALLRTPPSNQDSSQLVSATPEQQEPTARQLRRRLLRLRRKHDATLRAYHTLGTSYSEPISSLMYSLASELGREDNDLLWLAIVGVASTELYGRTATGFSLTNHDIPTAFTGWNASRGSRIRALFRDEVRRLNPPELNAQGFEISRGAATDAIPTCARSPTDNSIRLSPEPRFLLIRHWSLYDSMLHSPYLSAKLHVWNDAGKRRLHKLLAKMGVSLTQSKQSYIYMDTELKRDLRERLLRFAPLYGLDGLVPPPSTGTTGAGKDGWGFVRTWGWKACLSAGDVSVIIGAMLEAGTTTSRFSSSVTAGGHQLPTPPGSSSPHPDDDTEAEASDEEKNLKRFYAAYDALLSPSTLLSNITTAQSLHRAILNTGTALMHKRQIRNLRSFRLGLIKEGPDVGLFTAPGALTKLALWVGEAIAEMEKDDESSRKKGKSGPTPLVLGCLDEHRGVYVVVGMGGGGGAAGVVDPEKEKRRKERAERRATRRKEREARKEEKRKAKEARDEDDEDEDDETESEASDSSESDSESDSEDESTVKRRSKNGPARNRFGNAFQEVVEETSARVRMESFEHCVVEVRKEDLGGFLEGLSLRSVVG